MRCLLNIPSPFLLQMSSHSEDDTVASQMAEKKKTPRRKRHNRSRSSGSSDDSPDRERSRSRLPSSSSKSRSSRGGRKDSDELGAAKLAELLNEASKIVEYLSVSKLEINRKYAIESPKIYNNPGNDFGTGLQAILTDGDKNLGPFYPSVLLKTGHSIRKSLKALIRAR
jgi:hypothetical protein